MVPDSSLALRDKLRNRAQGYLQPGEQIQEVFLAQAGPNPNLGFITSYVVFFNRYKVVAVTNQAVLVLSAGLFSPAKPKAVEARIPRTTVLGPPEGAVWSRVNLPDAKGKTSWVHRRFYKDVTAADSEIASSMATQWAPPPPA